MNLLKDFYEYLRGGGETAANLEKLMATAQETLDAVKELGAKVDAFPGIVDNLELAIRELVAQIGGDSPETQAALQAIFDEAKRASGVADAAAADAADGPAA